MSKEIDGMFDESDVPTVRKGGVAIAPSVIKDMINNDFADDDDGFKAVDLNGGGDEPVEPASKRPSVAEVVGQILGTPAKAPEAETEKPKEDESPFTREEVKAVLLAQIKRRGYKKVYVVYEDFEVVFQWINDEKEAILNERVALQMSKGVRRTKIEIVEPYYDKKADRTIPGGRVETEYYLNTDAGRTNTRAEMAMYMYSIDQKILPDDIEEKLDFLITYSPQVLDAIYSKAFTPFMALLGEAQKDMLNFS